MAAHSETQQIAKAFAIFDDDGSGKISTSELKDVLCGGENPLSSPEEVDEALSEFDRDGDGKIGLEEFTALCLSLEDAEAEELQRLVMRRVNCKSGFEMLRGYDQFAGQNHLYISVCLVYIFLFHLSHFERKTRSSATQKESLLSNGELS